MSTTRREFLANSLSSATLLASAAYLPAFMTNTAYAAGGPRRSERILVVLQLTGGNDGLNTVVPYSDDHYHRARPTLRIREGQTLKLDEKLGLHPDMTAFKQMYDDGLLSVINNVGYPNPDRSHFSSMDIWHCAETQARRRERGWLGRAADEEMKPGAPPWALHLDGGPLPLALKNDGQPIPSIRDINAFRLRGDQDEVQQAIEASRSGALEDLLFVQKTALASCSQAQRLEQVASDPQRQADYPGYSLARRLQQIAQLIGADFGPRVYYTSLGGFDTHARQVLSHGSLLREMSESVAAFFADLKQRGLDDRVTLMTFSEFGRRVAENGSQGTDHGAAAPLFLAGPGVQAGVHGKPPKLDSLEQGDVRYQTDFRRIYAALLKDWLGVDAGSVLSERFEPLNIIT